MDKKYAIFDMDGTLVDSMSYWNNLAGEFLEGKGVAHVPREVIEKIKVMTITESAALFIDEFNLTGTPETVVAEMNAMMDEHYRRDIPLKSGVKEYLDSLHEKGVEMCVASATAEHLMEACLKRVGVMKYFKFLLSCETVGVGKHRADVYFEAAKRLQAKPCDTAVYEDAIYAASTAKKAGFYVIGVYDDSAKLRWKDIEVLADEVIKEF
ncbi:HAD family hydrolase [Clostridium culturomicium]|uniref:HAD family hydrolase n=1 Tax=Clostridium culturomicium TaxID=1499683 RepID=UPI00058EF816|nr:HAD family phosphatase [Clostridium culturomicium]